LNRGAQRNGAAMLKNRRWNKRVRTINAKKKEKSRNRERVNIKNTAERSPHYDGPKAKRQHELNELGHCMSNWVAVPVWHFELTVHE
jgi:hypothetical protein